VTAWLGRNDGDDLAVLAVRVLDPGHQDGRVPSPSWAC